MQRQRGFIVGLICTTLAAVGGRGTGPPCPRRDPATRHCRHRGARYHHPAGGSSAITDLCPAPRSGATTARRQHTLVELATTTDSSPPALNQSTAVSPRRYRLDLAPGENSFTLHYTGSIAHALQSQGEEYARSFQETRGIISPHRAYFSPAPASGTRTSTTHWSPLILKCIYRKGGKA